MIYLKRFLYILIASILCTLMILITILYVVFIPIGMIISFILTGDSMRYFVLLTRLEEYITDELERVLLEK